VKKKIGQQALLIWAKNRTRPYGIDVVDFHKSWSDGKKKKTDITVFRFKSLNIKLFCRIGNMCFDSLSLSKSY
jgi:hypothetical protein